MGRDDSELSVIFFMNRARDDEGLSLILFMDRTMQKEFGGENNVRVKNLFLVFSHDFTIS